MNVFDLAAKITLDQSEYDKGLKTAGSNMEGFGAKLKAGLGTAAKIGAAAVAAVGAAGAALTKTILDGASKTAAYGDNIDKMSQKMGISAQAYQEWDAILQHSGSSIDGMQRGMMTLSNAAVKGSEAFQKLGISQEEVASMSQEDLFAAVIKGLQGMEEGAERTALAQELLGGAAKELGPLLNTSAEDTEKMRQAVHDLGGVMSDEAVKASAAYQDSLQDMQTAFNGMKTKLFTSFMPGITTVMDGLKEIFSGNSDKGVGLIKKGMDNIGKTIKTALPKIISVAKSLMKTLGQVFIENLPIIIEAGTEILVSLVVGIVQALPQLVAMIPTIIKTIWNALKENGPALKQAGLELLKMIMLGLSKGLAWGLGIIVKLTTKLWEAIKKATIKKWDDIKSSITKKIDEIKSVADKKWEAVKAKVTNVWTSIKTSISNTVNGIKTFISTAFDNIKTAVSSKIDAMKTAITSKFTAMKEGLQNIVDSIKGFFKFDFEIPKIKLPHFTIKPAGWVIGDLLKGIIPELSIQWYKKAYDNPYLFTKPTVMMRGFGDGNGGEIVYGHENLMNDIRRATKESDDLSRVIELLEFIIRYGLKVDINKEQIYRAVSKENNKRNQAGRSAFSVG